MEHILYQKEDKNIPNELLDRNRDVALSMCKICGKVESELSQECESDREKALKWWQYEIYEAIVNQTLTDRYFKGRYYQTLTDSEIEQIWRKETQHLSIVLNDDILNSAKYEERP